MQNIFQYSYLLITLYFLIIWTILFIFSKKNKKEIITASLICMVLGPLVQYMHLVDWWNPNLITDWIINPEDLLFGFTVGGISSAIYEVVLNRKERSYKALRYSPIYYALTLGIGSAILFIPFILWEVHSFTTSILAAIAVVLIIAIKRKDLVVPIIISGMLVAILSVPIYLFLLTLNPNVFVEQWFLYSLSGCTILSIPIEEIVWYLVVGLFFSTIHEFIYGIKFYPNR